MTKPVVNTERLAETFVELARIDSVSKEEGRICKVLRRKLEALGADAHVDDAGQAVGGNSGNLIARVTGRSGIAPLLLSAHMDTVEPGRGIVPVFENGYFSSKGDTILGADNKCGLAIIIEVLTCIREYNRNCYWR